MKTNHAALAKEFIKDKDRTQWHNQTLQWVRNKRDLAAKQVPEWEQLRQWASEIKQHTLSDLGKYLSEFEQKATQNGIVVHWAKNAEEHNHILYQIAFENKVKKIVKSKSMLTEECHLNPFLEERGIEIIDTDLGERIVQLRNEMPSHIVLPAIHLKREDVSKTFEKHLGTEPNNNDPDYLTKAARKSLRNDFLTAQMAITGVNFAVAETGAFVVCTNEGNADMGAHAAAVHVACMGIEKLIPKSEHLPVFLRLLARSATGQAVTTYTSHFLKPRPNQKMHIILLDNGRSNRLGKEDFGQALKCIRCAACFNTCPVYKRSGGHSYHNAIAGPIGSILNPNTDLKKNADLPFASTLCGSCTDVCPVKIDIHQQLWKWRQLVVKNGYVSTAKKWTFAGMALVLGKTKWFLFFGKMYQKTVKKWPFLIENRFNTWFQDREMPKVPEKSFRQWYQESIKNKDANTR